MNDVEFRRLLELFPIVRSRNYQVESLSSRQQTNRSAQNELDEWNDEWNDIEKKVIETDEINDDDAFWEKLKSAAEKKVGAAEAERFCKAFQQIHKKLVYNELSADAAREFICVSGSSKG